MKVTYVLSNPEICGGVKVVCQHASLLQSKGHEIKIAGLGPRPSWIPFHGEYFNLMNGRPAIEKQDIVIATYYTTIPLAEELGLGPSAHFCQGYEGNLPHLSSALPEIERCYSRGLKTFAVSPHVKQFLLARFGTESELTPPPLDPVFRPSLRLFPSSVPLIAIFGIFEAVTKGVRTALEAVTILKKRGRQVRVLRVTSIPISQEERELLSADIELINATPEMVARELRKADLLLAGNTRTEGFGLPVLEALRSKVPVVSSDIPAAKFVAGDACIRVPEGDSDAFADAAAKLLDNPLLWRSFRKRGFDAARRFHPERIIEQLEASLVRAIEQSREMSRA